MSRYATLDSSMGGLDYRAIALHMSRNGHVLGHSTVRNVILRVMERFATAVMGFYGVYGDPAEVARDPSFQRAMADLVQEAVRNRNVR